MALTFTEEQEMPIVDFLCDNELIYNRRLINYRDPMKKEALYDEFCLMSLLEKEASKKLVNSVPEDNLLSYLTHMKSGQGMPHLTSHQM